jgi:hypothetical protein
MRRSGSHVTYSFSIDLTKEGMTDALIQMLGPQTPAEILAYLQKPATD